MKKKITVLTLCAMLLALCVSTRAQQPRVPRIGWLSAAPLSANADRIEAFRQGLRELGYMEGKNIVIEWRSAEGKPDRVPTLVAELVAVEGRCHRYGWFGRNPSGQGGNFDDSDCDGAGSRSYWKWVRR